MSDLLEGYKTATSHRYKYRAGCVIITVPAILKFDNNITALCFAGTANACIKIVVLIQSLLPERLKKDNCLCKITVVIIVLQNSWRYILPDNEN